jgi:hypothetical protein
MRSDDEDLKEPLRRRWTDSLARWLGRGEENPDKPDTAQPTTAASQTMRETLDEPHD